MKITLGPLRIEVKILPTKKPKKTRKRIKSRELYRYRRKNGLCTHCGEQVEDTNRYTGLNYKLCRFCRAKEYEGRRMRKSNLIK